MASSSSSETRDTGNIERSLHQLVNLSHDEIRALAKNIASKPSIFSALQKLLIQIDEITKN